MTTQPHIKDFVPQFNPIAIHEVARFLTPYNWETNPAYAVVDFLLRSRLLRRPESRSNAFTPVVPAYATVGKKSYGVSAGYGEVHVTLRSHKAN